MSSTWSRDGDDLLERTAENTTYRWCPNPDGGWVQWGQPHIVMAEDPEDLPKKKGRPKKKKEADE